MTTYTVNYWDPETEAETPIGQLGYGDRGLLTFLSAIPSHEEYLRTLVERLNKLPQLSKRTDPRPDAPRFTLTTRKVPRYSPEFRDVLKAYLKRLYQLTLTTTKEEEPTELIAATAEPDDDAEWEVPEPPVPASLPADAAELEVETPAAKPNATARKPFLSLLDEVAEEEQEEPEEPEEPELPDPPERVPKPPGRGKERPAAT